jgi:ferrous iron transport protein B
MHRHTGNWAGKTVDIAAAYAESRKNIYSLADIPGTYSLLSHSEEEEIARNYICFGGADITVVVCDATSLEHSLGLVLQILEVGGRVAVAVNLMDEAERIGISIDTEKLSRLLGVPVVGVVARKKRSLESLLLTLDNLSDMSAKESTYKISYPKIIANAAELVERELDVGKLGGVSPFWAAMRLIEADEDMTGQICERLSVSIEEPGIAAQIDKARKMLFDSGIDNEKYKDQVVGAIISEAGRIAAAVTERKNPEPRARERRIDRILTGRLTAFPVMLALLGLVLWITLSLANYPSAMLSGLFSYIEGWILRFFEAVNAPPTLRDAFVFGMYRTLSRVVAVMLPPMVIFFPMFTLLEDSGYLPRVAYNLDRPFACAGACGKQALTMCMGLGCNAVGITGARIIDSKRERSLAIVTNSLIPCNGMLPMLISVISVAGVCTALNFSSLSVALILLCLIILSIAVTFGLTAILSKTVFSGEPSSFTIELPPYRRPQFLRVIFRSLTTRVLSVLLRAVIVAAPMGLLIFILSNIYIGDSSLVSVAASALDPVGKIMGMDGEILLAFILGLPANEIVIPILIMLYTSSGFVGADMSIESMAEIFIQKGWTPMTAVSVALFALFHWPCSTSIITVYKETKSLGQTALAVILPTAVGFLLCVTVNLIGLIF